MEQAETQIQMGSLQTRVMAQLLLQQQVQLLQLQQLQITEVLHIIVQQLVLLVQLPVDKLQ